MGFTTAEKVLIVGGTLSLAFSFVIADSACKGEEEVNGSICFAGHAAERIINEVVFDCAVVGNEIAHSPEFVIKRPRERS